MNEFRRQLTETGRSFHAVFANPQLRKLQLAFAGSVTGEWGFLVALAVYANDQGGATAVSAVLVIRWVASALTAPWLAYFADRYPREPLSSALWEDNQCLGCSVSGDGVLCTVIWRPSAA